MARVDQPELYTLDGEDKDAEPKLIYAFAKSDANGIVNICGIPGRPDEFMLLTGIVDLLAVEAHNFIVWRLVLSPDDSSPPQINEIAQLPEAGLALDLTVASDHVLLITDSDKHCIYRLDTTTGQISVLLESHLFKAASAEDFFGLNRLCVVKNYIWFTNSSCGIMGRIPIEVDEDGEVRTAGDVEVLTTGLPHCDGLAVSPDARCAYTACMTNGKLWMVDFNEDGTASTRVAMENLVCPTAVELVLHQGKPKLYVVCSGEIQVGWKNKSNSAWTDIKAINSAVTVTEVTVTEVVTESRC